MPDCIPNLAGTATQDLVETIGAGSFKASYINWARTMNLLHEHAPGWSPEMIPCPTGGWIHPAPGSGGFLMIRFVHIDGTALPAYPQSIMDHRNNSIPLEKITARDITDTHRRGACMAAAMEFGLGYELWAKMPLESGYAAQEDETAVTPAPTARQPLQGRPEALQATRDDFLSACLEKGLSTHASEKLLEVIGTNYSAAIKTLAGKSADWVVEQNDAAKPATPAKPTSKKPQKPDPSEY
jgi:hypothetical protein